MDGLPLLHQDEFDTNTTGLFKPAGYQTRNLRIGK